MSKVAAVLDHFCNLFANHRRTPWGGYKQSGIGRELGTFGLDAYMEVKQININLVPNGSAGSLT